MMAVPGLGREHTLRRDQFISGEVLRLELPSSVCLLLRKVTPTEDGRLRSRSATPLHVRFFALGQEKTTRHLC